MGKYCYRIIIAMLFAFFVQSMAGAISSEFKNSLEKVELLKTGDSNYNIDLYMQKNYSSPVKVIKKSELSYYILLPETKNLSKDSNYKTSEIQSINTSSYPYAGVDVANGYTKININTTKPIDFNLNIKNLSQKASAVTNTPVQKKTEVVAQAKKEEPKETKLTSLAQDKAQNNTTQSKVQNNTSKNQPTQQKQNLVPIKTKLGLIKQDEAKNNTVEKSKNQNTENKQTKLTKQQSYKKTLLLDKKIKEDNIAYNETKSKTNPIQQTKKNNNTNNISLKNTATNSTNNIKTVKKVQENTPKEDTVKENNIEEHVLKNNIQEDKTESKFDNNKELIAQALDINNTNNNKDIDESDFSENSEDVAYAAKIPYQDNIKTLAVSAKSKMANILKNITETFSGIDIAVFPFLIAIAAFGTIAMLLILSNKQNNVKLKRKSDLVNLSKKPSLVPKKNSASKSKGDDRYFVFDKNVKQTGFLDPATSAIKKNYELSAYDPDINSNYSHYTVDSDNGSEYDIIQKILKEDTYIELNSKEQKNDSLITNTIENDKIEATEKPYMVQNTLKNETITKEPEFKTDEIIQTSTAIKEEVKEEAKEKVTEQPHIQSEKTITATSPIPQSKGNLSSEIEQTPEGLTILSKFEISPERGFMCVAYNNATSLIGYIFDEIFVLHNFKNRNLENYNIQCRLSEKYDNSALYIVKISNEKMIIRVANKVMKLEITL